VCVLNVWKHVFRKERTITREIGGPTLATLAKSKHGGFVLRLSQSRQCWPSYFPSWVHGFAILCLHVCAFFGGPFLSGPTLHPPKHQEKWHTMNQPPPRVPWLSLPSPSPNTSCHPATPSSRRERGPSPVTGWSTPKRLSRPPRNTRSMACWSHLLKVWDLTSHSWARSQSLPASSTTPWKATPYLP